MNHYFHTAIDYVTTHKIAFIIGSASTALLIALFAYNYKPTLVYKPQDACAILTPAKAQELLGDKVISVDTQGTTLTGDIATSKCSYTDENRNHMKVAAIAVRSGINDDGVAQNKIDFTSAKPSVGTQEIKNIGERAYFNAALGQLNILNGRQWIIISYGEGTTPEANTVEDAVSLAHKILN